ncbi:hypothetical protein P7H16_11345 [Paenibacillus larvae]|nr:hypothetical protein [Paenibacillus larvae]MDT2247402.1 hypothetical protein [Paenibacillus larvae]
MRQTQVMNSELDKNTVTDWVRKYKADGLDGLKESEDVKLTQRICNWLQSEMYYR